MKPTVPPEPRCKAVGCSESPVEDGWCATHAAYWREPTAPHYPMVPEPAPEPDAAKREFLARAFDWDRWPKLAGIFRLRPRVNVYWQELADFVTGSAGYIVPAAPPTVAPARETVCAVTEEHNIGAWPVPFERLVALLDDLVAMLERDRASRSPGPDVARELLQRFHGGDEQGHLYFGGDGKLCRKDGVPCLRCAITAFLNGSSQ